jgi:hypothetical protein
MSATYGARRRFELVGYIKMYLCCQTRVVDQAQICRRWGTKLHLAHRREATHVEKFLSVVKSRCLFSVRADRCANYGV